MTGLPEKASFGQHLEYVLTYLGDRIIESKDHELESIKLGLISDEEKLRMLKQELYRAATARANTEHVQNLTRAITAISEQIETEHNRQRSPIVLALTFLNSAILTSVIAAFLSFPATWSCNLLNNSSQFCQISKVVPTSVIKFFNESK